MQYSVNNMKFTKVKFASTKMYVSNYYRLNSSVQLPRYVARDIGTFLTIHITNSHGWT